MRVEDVDDFHKILCDFQITSEMRKRPNRYAVRFGGGGSYWAGVVPIEVLTRRCDLLLWINLRQDGVISGGKK